MYNLFMLKLKVLFDDMIGDIISCWNFANQIFDNPPIDKHVALLGLALIFIIPLFVVSNQNGIYLYFVRVLSVSLITFAVLTWSNTFWFIMKKTWMYKIHIKKRKSINYYLNNINTLKIEDPEAENPEGALYVISNYNSVGFRKHAFRNAIEVALLLLILLITMPLFFLFNLALFCVQFFYIFIFDNQSSSQVFNDLKTLVFCVHKLYKTNPEDCSKLIFENKMESMRELRTIYRAIELSVK